MRLKIQSMQALWAEMLSVARGERKPPAGKAKTTTVHISTLSGANVLQLAGLGGTNGRENGGSVFVKKNAHPP
jgi:hypothetical protein